MTRALVVTAPGLDPAPLYELAGVCDEVETLSLVAPGEPAVSPGDGVRLCAVVDGNAWAETASAAIARVARSHDAQVVVLPAIARFREAMPLVVHALDAAAVSDVIALAWRDGVVLAADRLLYGGVAIATVALNRPTAVVTCAPGRGASPEGLAAVVVDVGPPLPVAKELIGCREVVHDGALASASRLVSFGRGVRNRDDMALIENLASAMDAALGCSRPIVEDMRWLDVDHQVGLTGTAVTPELYVAVGISGQIQHLVGMRDSGMIVAINSNPAAPIFTVADVGVVGDLYEIVPALTEALAVRSG